MDENVTLRVTCVLLILLHRCIAAASCHHAQCGCRRLGGRVATHHVADPVTVLAQLGVDGGVSGIAAAVSVPLHTLQLVIAHHHAAAVALERRRERPCCCGCLRNDNDMRQALVSVLTKQLSVFSWPAQTMVGDQNRNSGNVFMQVWSPTTGAVMHFKS